MLLLTVLQLLYYLLLLRYLLLVLGYLVHDLVQLLLHFQKLRPDLPRTDLRVQQLLVLFFYFPHVLLILYLKLMEIDEFQLVSHLFFLRYLVPCFYYLSCQRLLFVFVLFDQCPFLSIFFLEKFLYPFCLYVACSTILSAHQDLPLEVIGVLSDFGDGHVGLLEDSPQSFEDGIGLDSALFDGVFEGFCLLLGDLVFLFGGEGASGGFFLADSVFEFFAGLFLLYFVVLFEAHVVGFEEEVFTFEVFAFLEVGFELLGEFLDSQEFLALLRRLQLPFRHISYILISNFKYQLFYSPPLYIHNLGSYIQPNTMFKPNYPSQN